VPVAKYRVTDEAVQLSYPPERVARAGDEVEDLPAESIDWLTRRGFIEKVEAAPRKRTPKAPKGGEGE
jgi:hypothetical protein